MQESIPSTSTIYISNISEDVWPFISAMSDAQAKVFEIEENARLADRELVTHAAESDELLILPDHIDPKFIDYYFEVFNPKRIRIVTPKIHTGEICIDILKDPLILQEIDKQARVSQRLEITSYSTSSQFFALVGKLKEKYSHITTPESPEEEDGWTVNFFGSKSGIRQLSQQAGTDEPDFKMPAGLICMGIEDAAKIAANKYVSEGGVVIKTNKGHAGAGVLIFRPGDLPGDYHSCRVTIGEQLKKDKYWSKFPIIIENYIAPNLGIAGGFPNVEFKIFKSGRVEFLYYGGMRVTRQGVYQGMEISNDCLSDKLAARVMDTGFYLGEQLAKEGYRGHFDVDFIAAKNGDLFVTESNVRRTGGTHVYYASLALFGKDFLYETYSLHNNFYQIPGTPQLTFEQLHARLSQILFDKQHQEGLVFTTANFLRQGVFGYIIFGKNKKRALEIEQRMANLLNQSFAKSH